MPSNRVSDCRASKATRDEDRPDPPTVKHKQGHKENKKMTKLQEFMLEISRPKKAKPGLPDYADMSAEEKVTIDNLRKAVAEAIRVFSKYE